MASTSLIDCMGMPAFSVIKISERRGVLVFLRVSLGHLKSIIKKKVKYIGEVYPE